MQTSHYGRPLCNAEATIANYNYYLRRIFPNQLLRRFRFDRGEIWHDFPQVNGHRLTESDFGYDVILSRWRA